MKLRKLLFGKLYERLESQVNYLRGEIEMLKNCNEDARIANFIRVVECRRDMSLNYDAPTAPIRLEELQRRIEELEKP